MCGRFTLTSPSSALVSAFGLASAPAFSPRYNIAPTQPVVAVRAPGPRGPELVTLRWGLVPSWAKDASIGARMINARAETVHEKPSFRSAFRRRRCLIPADGYYEWQKTAAGKQPYLITASDGRLFAFAGLWESWAGAGEKALETCTILTSAPQPGLRAIHDRMPVILAPDRYERWLDPSLQDQGELLAMLRPDEERPLQAVAVSTWVNHVGHDDPRCVQPLDPPPTEV